MAKIGEIVSQADLAAIQAENAKYISQKAYVAPTVYKLAGASLPRWNYYATRDGAMAKFLYLNGKGGANTTPAGDVAFTGTAAQTMGINVDFFIYSPYGWLQLPYAALKKISNWQGVVCRFYKTNGAGPYYAILDQKYFGATATPIANVPANKVAELDAFHRQLQILKVNHNTLAVYLNDLSKKNLNATQQRSFNEGLLLLNNLKEQMRTIKGVDFSYGSDGKVAVGFIPILYIVAVVVVAAAAAWAVVEITTQKTKLAQLNAAYDMQKWIAQQKLNIAAAKAAGTITPDDASRQTAELENANKAAQNNAETATQDSKGFLDKVENILLIGLAALAVTKFVK